MSRITPVSAKKRKLEEAMRGKTSSNSRKRVRKQKHYHSSSSEDEDEQDVGFAPVSLADSEDEVATLRTKSQKKQKGNPTSLRSHHPPTKNQPTELTVKDAPTSSDEDEDDLEGATIPDDVQISNEELEEAAESAGSGSNSDADSSGTDTDSDTQPQSAMKKPLKKKSKRNDPDAFSNSMSKILSTKLPTSVRHDPVLSRSLEVSKSRQEASNDRLEAKARAQIRADKQSALRKGRTTDVLGIERGIAGEVAEKEKGLRKIAQKGVIQLFNAFRAAHVKAEEARKEERKKGTVGIGERERKVNEVSKEGFLELIGGKKKPVTTGTET